MIIGITGTDGAGKGTVVQYLVDNEGYTHYSSREFLLTELQKANIMPTRNELRLIANKLRAQHGDDYLAKRAYELINKKEIKKAAVESIRTTAEALYIKQHGGILLAVDANPEIRYDRVQKRRSESDKVSYEEFLAHEELERNDPDPHGMQKAKVMEMADYTIMNDSSIEELQKQVDLFLKEVSKE